MILRTFCIHALFSTGFPHVPKYAVLDPITQDLPRSSQCWLGLGCAIEPKRRNLNVK
uniref:Uncharacterized protein n=1 Tax=Phlebia radiata TaxID=5308 RepID=L8B974_PHLRA|nr:hypothetical protein PRA_mt0172 [Phlebia radiata]CCE89239.1 hypothetical protein PRA_mt0172 [Phlebia radiata]